MRIYGERKETSVAKTARPENKTYTFFRDEFMLEPDKQTYYTNRYDWLYNFIKVGMETEGRNPATLLPNFYSFIFVLHTSGKDIPQDTILDCFEVALSNTKVPDEDISRYAWGVMKKMTEKVA